jgi:hypothetical protein
VKASAGGRILPWLLPSLGNVVWIACFIGVLGLGPKMMNVDGDLGRHITIGRYILETGRIPTADIFSHTLPGKELTPHEWLAQVIFALAWKIAGLNGVVILTALVIAFAFWVAYRRAVRESGSLLAGLAFGILGMAASSIHWLTRPHIFTFLLLALWIEVLERMRAGKAKAWIVLPVLMAVWANLHGAFIAGFMLWLLYGAGYAWERWIEGSPGGSFSGGFGRALLIGGGASLLASLVNPVGFRLLETSLGYVSNAYLVGHTVEYMSPDFHMPATWPYLLMILASLGLLGVQVKKRVALDVFLLAAWTAMSLYSIRNVPLYVIVSAPILSRLSLDLWAGLAERWKPAAWLQSLDRRLLSVEISLRGFLWPGLAAVLLSLGLLAGARLDFQQKGNQFDAKVFPVDAVAWLRGHPQQGEVFNYFPWGGYLLYEDWPQMKVFIDGQTDFYGEALTREYEKVLTLSPGWQGILVKYQVGWVIMPPDEPLARGLADDPGWQEVYQDETASILARREK